MGKKKLTLEEFIERAKKIHGDKFDYSESIYVNLKTKLTVKCKNSHSFSVTPYSHINLKSGCPQCYYDSNKMTQEEFIEKAKKIHGDKYDYSESVYIDTKTKLTEK